MFEGGLCYTGKSGDGDKIEAKNAEVIRKELLEKGARSPRTRGTCCEVTMIILHKSPEPWRRTCDIRWNTRACVSRRAIGIRSDGATGSVADGAKQPRRTRTDYAAKGFSFSAGDWDKREAWSYLRSQIPRGRRWSKGRHVHGQWIILQNATSGMAEQAEELRRPRNVKVSTSTRGTGTSCERARCGCR